MLENRLIIIFLEFRKDISYKIAICVEYILDDAEQVAEFHPPEPHRKNTFEQVI